MKHKSEGGGEPGTPAPTSITNHACKKKNMYAPMLNGVIIPEGCSGSPLKYMHIYAISRVHTITRVTVVTTSDNPQPCFKMTTEKSHSSFHSTDCTKAPNAPLHTRDSNPFYNKIGYMACAANEHQTTGLPKKKRRHAKGSEVSAQPCAYWKKRQTKAKQQSGASKLSLSMSSGH